MLDLMKRLKEISRSLLKEAQDSSFEAATTESNLSGLV
jgi:hypothetical protein